MTHTTLELARAFAIAAHGMQQYGEQPYLYHLEQVVSILAPFGEAAQVVGYLHDVVEDTDATCEDLVNAGFSPEVAWAVAFCTDEAGANRRERKARTNAKLKNLGPENHLALIAKAADRLANLRESALGGDKLEMYRREHADFRSAAYREGLCDALWEEMERILKEGAQ